MHRNVVPWLKVSVCGLALCGHLALLATLMYPPTMLIIVAIAIAAMPLGERLQQQRDWYTHITSAASILALVLILGSAPAFGPMDTVLWLMVLVQVHVLLHRKRQRHYAYLILMGFSQVMAASMMSPDPAVALVLLLLVIFTVWSLVLLDIFRSTHERGDVVVHGTLDHDSRNGVVRTGGLQYFRRSLVNWSAALVVLTILFSGVYFVLMPRTEAGAFGTEEIFPAQEEFTTGLSSEIDLRSSGRITEDRTAVMQVTFPDSEDGRFAGPMYWRVITFDTYTGQTWERTGLTTNTVWMVPRVARFAITNAQDRPNSEGVYRITPDSQSAVRYNVYLAQLPPDGVPLLSFPQMVQPAADHEGTWQWDSAGDFSVQYADRGESGARYEAVSVVPDFTPEELRRSSEDFRNLMNGADFQLLTEQDLLPSTVDLANEITAGETTLYGTCRAIRDYFSGPNFEYTLDIPELPGQNPMDSFITDIRRGHCQLYASAMALMLRSQGVPCRLTTGYRGGVFDPDDETYTVTANMAHVWVEVFFPDYGWVTFDPSPQAQESATFSIDNMRTSYNVALLKLRLFWLENVVGFQSGRATGDESSESRAAAGGVSREESEEAPFVSSQVWAARGAVLVMLGVLSVPVIWFLGALRRRRKLMAGLAASQRRAVRLYGELRRRLLKLGIKADGLTAEELYQWAREAELPDAPTVAAVVAAYNDARFGGRSLSEEDCNALRKDLKQLRPAPS